MTVYPTQAPYNHFSFRAQSLLGAYCSFSGMDDTDGRNTRFGGGRQLIGPWDCWCFGAEKVSHFPKMDDPTVDMVGVGERGTGRVLLNSTMPYSPIVGVTYTDTCPQPVRVAA